MNIDNGIESKPENIFYANISPIVVSYPHLNIFVYIFAIHVMSPMCNHTNCKAHNVGEHNGSIIISSDNQPMGTAQKVL